MSNDAKIVDLIQAARCEDLNYQQVRALSVLGDYEKNIVSKLKQSGAHLLMGSRGVGKSMLLRTAEIEMDDEFTSEKALAVYVNFKTSTLLEGVKAGERDAFQIWVGAKILQAVHDKLIFFDLIKDDDVDDPYRRIFNISSQQTKTYLKEKIHLLQSLCFSGNKEKELTEIGDSFLDRILDTSFILEILKELTEKFNLKSMIFLFDEAAHTFIPSQQEIFFEIFKLLHGDRITVKAAVYPTITSYGRNFEIGQDAIVLSVDRFEPGEIGRKTTRSLFRDMLIKRLPPKTSMKKKVFQSGELLDLCIDLSTGNPRAFLHLLNSAYENGFSERAITLAAQNYIDTELMPYHINLSKRLPKYSNHVRVGLDLLRGYIIPEIRNKNFRVKKSDYQSAFFTVPRDISPNLKLSLDILCYSGILTSKGTVKIAERKTAPRYMIHLSLMATEKAFSKTKLRDAISSLSLTDYREFSSGDPKIKNYVADIMESKETCQACGADLPPNARFCNQCGAKVEQTTIISSLLEEPVTALSISDRLKNRIKDRFPKVGNVVQANRQEIMTIKYIKEVRSRIIKNAADEFISG